MIWSKDVAWSAFGGIGHRLGIILVCMGAMTAGAIFVGKNAFQSTIAEVETFSNQSIPELTESAGLIATTYELLSGLSAVLYARDAKELHASYDQVAERLAALQKDAKQHGAQAMLSPLLQVQLDIELFRDFREIEFREQDQVAAALSRLRSRAQTIGLALMDLKAKQLEQLDENVDRTVAAMNATQGKISVLGVDALRLAYQAESEVNLLTGIALARGETSDPELRRILQGMGRTSLKRLHRSVVELSVYGILPLDFYGLSTAEQLFQDIQANGGISSRFRRQDIIETRRQVVKNLNVTTEFLNAELVENRSIAADSNEQALHDLMNGIVTETRDLLMLDSAMNALISAGFEVGTASNQFELKEASERLADSIKKVEPYLDPADVELQLLVKSLSNLTSPKTGLAEFRRRALMSRSNALEASLQATESVSLAARAATNLGVVTRTKMTAISKDLVNTASLANTEMSMLGLASAAFFFFAMGFTFVTVIRPMRMLCFLTERLATGDLSPIQPSRHQSGEIGRMARALKVFRKDLVQKIELEKDERDREARERLAAEIALKEQKKQAQEREQRELEHAKADADRKEKQAKEKEMLRRQADEERQARLIEQEELVSALATGLTNLAEQSLLKSIHGTFPDGYESLRHNFNSAVTTLGGVIRQIATSAKTIDGSSTEMSAAADDLSTRTEYMAGTLEETAAALRQLTDSVSWAAQNAHTAHTITNDAKDRAIEGKAVVEKTASAMSKIEESSEKIAHITGIIEDIAFQTNLLALNAGVEAARAGEAGRGFAVVATEVRGLAHRTSEAAKEISALITESETNVKLGARLVGQTGGALQSIAETVTDASAKVAEIAESVQLQSEGVSEINNSMTELDKVTQRNSALFQETNALIVILEKESSTLNAVVQNFEISDDIETGDLALPVVSDTVINTELGDVELVDDLSKTAECQSHPEDQGNLPVFRHAS